MASHYPSRGEIKKVFGGISGDALVSGKTGCSLKPSFGGFAAILQSNPISHVIMQ